MATPTELPGYALLIAAEPPVRHPLPVAATLPQLAAIPPSRLVGTTHASAVQVANPDDPNLVLTHLRTAAAVQGPLVIYVAGHLAVDPRQHQLHLALARTTARTIRYTALPWHWLIAELRHRTPGTTTVMADLAAEHDVLQDLARQDQTLTGPFTLYGAVQLHDRRHHPGPAYTHALAQILRTPSARPDAGALHHEAARAAQLEQATTVWLGGDAAPEPKPAAAIPAPRPEPAAPPTERDPHQTITQAIRSAHYSEAASAAAHWEQRALRQHGAGSPEVAHWIEVRAFIAMEEQAPDRACGLWLRGAAVRLGAGQTVHHPEVVEAVDRAHYAWRLVSDPQRARELGTELWNLRLQVTGSSGAREDVQQRLVNLSRAVQP
ncbi:MULTISPECIES: hypothetical protein [unclassified Streptomyces]|uniref:hypothetical protein n=1 Tax=unclassified Streptomyces TaxID=2593676 RepID=UPI00278C4D8B|nr:MULTISPECIES: hypothetical protein [unclassified Streptomyces]